MLTLFLDSLEMSHNHSGNPYTSDTIFSTNKIMFQSGAMASGSINHSEGHRII